MNKFLKPLLWLLPAMLFTATGWAADPVATWTDFNTLTSGNYTITTDTACTVNADGSVTLGGAGLSYAFKSGDGMYANKFTTVVMDVTLPDTEGTLLTLGLATNKIQVNSTGSTLTTSYDQGGVRQTGTCAAGRTTIAVTYSGSQGTHVYKDGVLIITDGDLKWSGQDLAKLTIGAYDDGTIPLTGTILHSMKIYAAKLSAEEVAFPSLAWMVPFNGANTTTGWVTSWGGEDGASYVATPNGQGYEVKSGYHPWVDYTLTKPSTVALYADISKVDASNSDNGAIMIAFGKPGNAGENSGNLVLAKKASDTVVVTRSGNVLASIQDDELAIEGSYHLFVFGMNAEGKVFLSIDGTTEESENTTTLPANGLQIGSMFTGVGSYKQGYNMVVDEVRGYNAYLGSEDLAKLVAKFPEYKPQIASVTLEADAAYSTLNLAEGDTVNATITLKDGVTLTMDEAPTCAKLTIVSEGTATVTTSVEAPFANVGNLTLNGNALTVPVQLPATVTMNATTITLEGGTADTPQEVATTIAVASGTTLKTKGYLNFTAENTIASGGTLEVVSGVTTFNLAGTGLNGTVKVAAGATFKNGTNDGPNYNGAPTLDIAGTLEVTGTARWSLPAGTTTTLREGAVLKGAGGSGYNYAYDWFNGATINVLGNATIQGNIGAHNGNEIVFNVSDGKTVTLSGKYDGGVYSGTAKLKTAGAGTLKLTGANTYTGGTTIETGAKLTITNAAALGTGAITGAGELICDGVLPTNTTGLTTGTPAEAETPASGWLGTVKLLNGNSYDNLNLASYQNDNSTIEIENVTCHLSCWNNGTTTIANLCLTGEGLQLDNGTSTDGSGGTLNIGSLSGTGKFKGVSGNTQFGYKLFVGDASDFSGELDLSTTGSGRTSVVIGNATTDFNGKIIIADAVTIANGKIWKAVNGVTVTATGVIGGEGTIASALTLADGATIDVDNGVVNVTGAVTVDGAVTVTGSVADGDYILKCTNATAEDAAKITVEGFAVTADATGYKAVAGGAVVDANLETTFTEADQTLTWSELVGDVNAEKLYQGGTLTITFTAEGQTFTFDKDAALAFSQITINGEYAGALAKTGSATVSATATAIDTDTTVEAGVASLGTVTIADDKTLTVKDVNTVEAFATESQGVYNLDLGETTADAYTIAADGKHYKVSSGTFTNAALNFSATQTNYEFAGGDLTLTGNEGQFSFGTADVTISGGTIRATHLITVQGGNDRSTTIEQTGGDIILSGTGNGSDTPMANQTIMFGHWRNASSNYTLSGGSLVAEEGGVRFGNDSSSAMTISGTGLFKVKGIKGKGTTESALTITGGKLSLGDWGFDAINSFTFSAQGGEINAFGNATINQTIALNGDVTLFADADKTLTIYTIKGSGTLTIAGEGTVALSDVVVKTIPVTVAEGATLKVIPTVDAVVLGKIILAEGSVVEGTLTVDGVEEFTRDGTTISFTPDATITGSAWWWDYEFNGSNASVGIDIGTMTLEGSATSYTEADANGNQELYFQKTPYRGAEFASQDAFTAVMYCQPGNYNNTALVGFGTLTGTTVILATGANAANGEMQILLNRNNSLTSLADNLIVPNATTAKHLYAFTYDVQADKTVISVYVDGKLKKITTINEQLHVTNGFQIGSVHGGVCTGLTKYPASGDAGTLDFLRVAKGVLSAETMTALAKAYPYVSEKGIAQRTIADATANWVADAAWTQKVPDTDDAMQAAPNDGTNVELTATADTQVTVNLEADASYETLTIAGSDVTFVAGEAAKKIVAGDVTIDANVTIPYGVAEIGTLTVNTGKTLTFDFSAYDFASIWADRTISLTGLAVIAEEATVTAVMPEPLPAQIQSATIAYNDTTQEYALEITVDSSALTGVISGDCTWDEISEWKIGETVVAKPSDWSLVQAVTLSGTGTVTLPEGGIAPDTLKIDGTITLALPGETTATIPSLVIGAGANVTIPQTLTVTAMEIGESATIGYAATSGMAIAEPLTGNYNLTVVSGTVTLTGASDNAAYTGTITVKNGATLALGYGVGLPETAPIALEDGATLFAKNGAGASSTIASAITIDGAVTIKGSENGEHTRFTGAISGMGTLTIASGDYTDKFAIDGAITGALKVVVSIGYDVTFTSNENAFTGGLEIAEGGRLTVTQPGAMGTGGVVNNGALTFAFPAEDEGGSYTDAFSGTGDYTLASGSLTWIFGADVAVDALTVSGGKMTIVPTVNNTSLGVQDAITIANGTLVIAPTATDGYNGVTLATDASVTIGNGGALAFSGETARLFAHGEIGSSAITVGQGGTIYAGVNGIPFPVTLANGSVLDLYGFGVDVDGGFLTTMTLQLTKALTLPTGENETVTVKLPTASSFLTYTGEAIEDWASRFVFTTSDGTPQTLEGVYLVDGSVGNAHNFTFASVVEIEGMSDAVAADIAQLVATLTGGEQLEVTEVVNADAAVCFEDIAYDYTLQEEVLQSGKVTLTYGFGVGDITVVQRTVDETTSNWIAVAVKVTDGGMGYGAENAWPAKLRAGTQIQLSKDGGGSYGETALTPLTADELTAAGLVNGEGVYWYWAETLPEIATGKTSTTVKYKVRAVNDGTAPAQE